VILHIGTYDETWTAVPNETIADVKIHKALGLLLWMLSKPESFQVTIKGAAEQTGWGHETVATQMQILRSSGYVHYARVPSGPGRSTFETLVYSRPLDTPRECDLKAIRGVHVADETSDEPTGNPGSGDTPQTGFPASGKPGRHPSITERVSTKPSGDCSAGPRTNLGRASSSTSRPRTSSRRQPDELTPEVDGPRANGEPASAVRDRVERQRSQTRRGPAYDLAQLLLDRLRDRYGIADSEISVRTVGGHLMAAHGKGEAYDDLRAQIMMFVPVALDLRREGQRLDNAFMYHRRTLVAKSRAESIADGSAFGKTPTYAPDAVVRKLLG
jgi:hypothetical protein